MKNSKQNEILILGATLAPLVYLASVWNKLPEKVAMHYNIHGEPDRYGSKIELILLTVLIPLGTYVLVKYLPKIDPKKKLATMAGKYNSIRIIVAVFLSLVMMYVINSSLSNELSSPNVIVGLIGLLFFVLGNFFKTFKPNYFMGIRTPWTLENETVWKETHVLGGKMWFIGGIAIVLLAFFAPVELGLYLFLAITATITIVPIVFSYKRYKELKK